MARLKRLLISPSGNAMRKLIPMNTNSKYHLIHSDQSSTVIAAVISTIQAMSKKREGSNHWNNLLQ